MHSFNETGPGVPAFLAKLWRLVDDQDTDNLICWSKVRSYGTSGWSLCASDGRSFIIQNQAQFARELLPLNYKHNNMASFIRQLNMYGFHKITSIENGGLKFDRDEMEFTHPCFKKDCPYLLEHIKRKIANTKCNEKTSIKQEAVSKVLQDVKAMRGRQDTLDSRFSVMKQENEALWREIASLRQKHAKQQQIVNKLIQFLITIVQPSRNMNSVKRHMQLMINDIPENSRLRKTSETESDSGPVIRELGEELLAENEEFIELNSPYSHFSGGNEDTDCMSPLGEERPHSRESHVDSHYDYSNESIEDVLMNTKSGNKESQLSKNSTSPSVVQSIGPDGSSIVYHVTEVPDCNSLQSSPNGKESSYSDDNVLTTPMVRQQMARSHMLKEQNKQRRRHQQQKQEYLEKNRQRATSTGKTVEIQKAKNIDDGDATSRKLLRASRRLKGNNSVTASSAKNIQRLEKAAVSNNNEDVQIKQEKADPMLIFNSYGDNDAVFSNVNLLSPDTIGNNADSDHSFAEDILPDNINSSMKTNLNVNVRGKDIYNGNNFIDNEMPNELFEDSSLIPKDNFDLIEQQNYGRSTASSGKFSSFIAGNNSAMNSSSKPSETSCDGASTSAAAAAANRAKNASYDTSTNNNNMAVTKYKNCNADNDGGLSLSTPNEVNDHLDNVQDELDSLKDLLRGEGYSLDANTLLGCGIDATTYPKVNHNHLSITPGLDSDFFNKLFNDADLIGPYGLSLNSDLPNDKKGSELMSYQPWADFSDMLDDKSMDADTPASLLPPPLTADTQNSAGSGNNSTLNTPRHE